MEQQITTLTPASPSLSGITAWLQSPDPNVGPSNSPLNVAPSGVDSATRALCKGQSYTSWDCYSRSYVASVTFGPKTEPRLGSQRQQTQNDEDLYKPDTPTEAEIAQMSRSDLDKIATNKYHFYRSVGILSVKQAKLPVWREKMASIASNKTTANTTTKSNTSRSRSSSPKRTKAKTTTTKTATSANTTSTATTKQSVPKPASPPPNLVQAPAPSNQKTAYSDTLPVRCFNVTTYKTKREMGMSVPYSPIYTAFVQRLSDPASTGALGSVVRSPSVRDATSLAALCKYLYKDTGTFYEMAPIIRLACIATSLCPPNYSTEVIPYRFTRDFKPNRQEFYPPEISSEVDNTQHINMIAMPLDVYVAWVTGKMNPVVGNNNQNWVPNRMDEYWTAVPCRSEFLTRRAMIPYIISFLHSLYWSGRVNWFQGGLSSPNVPTPDNTMETSFAYMPSTSSIHIPGPQNVILVLVDSTSQYGSTEVQMWGPLRVPVYRGTTLGPDNQPVDMIGPWNNWFTTDNIPNIIDDCNSAYAEVTNHLSVENNTELSLSLVAEVYATLYQGLGVRPYQTSPEYTTTIPAYGAWKMTEAEPLAPKSSVMCDKLKTDEPDFVTMRRQIVGYNFSSLTSLHRPPSGLSKTRAFAFPSSGVTGRVWLGWHPDDHTPTYNVTSMDSLYRVAVYVDLVLTHEKTLLFPSSQALPGWIHMLSGALSSQTAMAFSQNDVSLAVWTGYDTRFDSEYASEIMERLLDVYTTSIVRYINISQLVNMWGEWDENTIIEYYGIDPFDNDDWMSYSPIPFHLSIQWIQKMAYNYGTAPTELSLFRHMNTSHMGLLITGTTGEFKSRMVCTIDFERYRPLVVFRQEDQGFKHLAAWIDNWSYISNSAAKTGYALDPSFLESQTFVLSPINNALSYTPILPMYVLNSGFSNISSTYKDTNVSSIQYPDPLDLHSILQGAKNYLLYPALSALTGYLAGGPAGAVVAGATTLAKNISDKISNPDVKQGITTALGTATQVFKESQKKEEQTPLQKAVFGAPGSGAALNTAALGGRPPSTPNSESIPTVTPTNPLIPTPHSEVGHAIQPEQNLE